MKRRLAIVICICMIITALSNIYVLAESAENEITREEVEVMRPSISKREATISMLLNAGWTMADIEEWHTEESLKELDEKALAISESVRYTANHEDADTGEVVTEELTRQEFDYGVNKVKCAEEPDTTELNTISSNGILELQPIYSWMDAENEYPSGSSQCYFDLEDGGYSGSSVWHNDSTCYLKQNMGLIWQGSSTYTVQYRYEWMTEPTYKLTDHFAIALSTGLLVHSTPNLSFTLKYKTLGNENVETYTPASQSGRVSIKVLSMGQGRQISVLWPRLSLVGSTYYGENVRGFLTFNAFVNVPNTYTLFVAYAQYYHGKIAVNPDVSIGFSTTDASISFSINPEYNYTAEEHAMEVRARNINLA